MKSYAKIFLVFLVVMSCSMLAYSQNPARDLQDIVGERGSYAEMDLEKRGYVHIKTTRSGYNLYSSWWSPSQKKCVTYHLSDGNVRSVNDVPPFDCNKSNNAGYSQSWSGNHNSNHHSNYAHYENNDHEAAFERGHNDGLYNKAYHNIYQDSYMIEAYAKGYQSGVNQRGHNTSHHSGRGGYQSHARVDDIVGLSVDSAAERMGSRGFTEVNQYKHDGKTHRIYYNRNTGQCVDLRSMHDKVGHVENSTRCNR